MSDQVSSKIKVAILGKNADQLASELQVTRASLDEADVAIFIVSAHDGITRADIEEWQRARELYIPSLVAISEAESGELDFDDMSAIASKMLDPLLIRYLVLYDDTSIPVALIDLESLKIIDYSIGKGVIRESEQEHRDLVETYRDEYFEMTEGMGSGAVGAGLIYPAFPWIQGKNIGLDQLKEVLESIPGIR